MRERKREKDRKTGKIGEQERKRERERGFLAIMRQTWRTCLCLSNTPRN